MKTNFTLSSRKKLTIFPISDLHVGSKQFDEKYFKWALTTFDLCTDEKVIYLGGDLLESASLNVGNSSFNQIMDVNEQIEMICDLLSPYENYINGMVPGNHELRLKKQHDLNINEILADKLNIKSEPNVLQTLNVNGKDFIVYCTHGRNSSSQDHLALGKIQRDTSMVHADLYLYGHLHRLDSISIPYKYNGGMKRRTYVLTGAFLKYKGSYAEDMGLPQLPPAFCQIKVGAKLDVNVKSFYQDICREDLLEL